jgi:gliding motility-associated-like protein
MNFLIRQLPKFNLEVTDTQCSPALVRFFDNTDSPNTYNWVFSDSIQKNGNPVSQKFEKSGTYQFLVKSTTSFGCMDSIVDSITIINRPVANFTLDPKETDLDNSTIQLINLSQGAKSYEWYPEIPFDSMRVLKVESPVYTYEKAGEYYPLLIARNQYCSDSTFRKLVINTVFSLFIPNAFSPGENDALNQFFGPVGRGIESFQITIYNRWGEEMYKGMDFWNGKFNGELVSEDTYVYLMTVNSFDGKSHFYEGMVQVIR